MAIDSRVFPLLWAAAALNTLRAPHNCDTELGWGGVITTIFTRVKQPADTPGPRHSLKSTSRMNCATITRTSFQGFFAARSKNHVARSFQPSRVFGSSLLGRSETTSGGGSRDKYGRRSMAIMATASSRSRDNVRSIKAPAVEALAAEVVVPAAELAVTRFVGFGFGFVGVSSRAAFASADMELLDSEVVSGPELALAPTLWRLRFFGTLAPLCGPAALLWLCVLCAMCPW